MHRRLWHRSIKVMSHLPTTIIEDSCEYPCDIFHFAKFKRLPFSLSSSYSSMLFELVHIDIWGPYKTCSSNGFRYFLRVLDDFIRCTWGFVMKFKPQTTHVFSAFMKLVKTHFGLSVKRVRSDNGSEFLSPIFQHLLSDNDINHEKSCTYTPKQNGRAE